MYDSTDINGAEVLATTLKLCPFCGSRGHVVRSANQSKFGVRCVQCAGGIPDTHLTLDLAISAWCQRRGTCAAAGGRATKGKSSWRKRRSSRRNLRFARKRKKLKLLKTRFEILAVQLKEFRAMEKTQLEAEIANDRAWLQKIAPLIAGDHVLAPILALLKSHQERSAGYNIVNGSDPFLLQTEPCRDAVKSKTDISPENRSTHM
jgi:hypothetical protein